MQQALALAQKGRGKTSPNPLVGAVLVKNGAVVGAGYHKKAGGPHAEIAALRQAGSQAQGADLYVNLEPCCHTGKTPPCTEALLKAGIRHVYIGMRDPNPLVCGKGIRALKKGGIGVTTGILRKECAELNAVFIKYIQTGEPYVILKSALSLDGKIATRTGASKWITGAKARRTVHALREQVDAILVGAGTVLKDNPMLTVRTGKRNPRHPIRVVVDRRQRVPLNAKVFQNTKTQRVILACGKNPSASRKQALTAKGIEILSVKETRSGVDLSHLMRKLGEREITSVLIEAGGEINASALKAGIVDKVIFFIAPAIIGGSGAPGPVGGAGIETMRKVLKLENMKITPVGEDWMVEATPEKR